MTRCWRCCARVPGEGARRMLMQAIEAEGRKEAEGAFDRFVAKYGAKYAKAAA